MARTRLTSTGTDLITDGGNVLWSIVKGEQLELEIDLALLGGAPSQNFVFECDYIEALGPNFVDISNPGAKGSLVVRYLNHRGAWDAGTEYSKGDCCVYLSKGYMRIGARGTSSVTPDVSTDWKEASVNLVFIQFMGDFCDSFITQPSVDSPASAFFEVKVSELITATETPNNNKLISRAWKPIRGRVEVLYSPTSAVV
jgi:hypothetical protein